MTKRGGGRRWTQWTEAEARAVVEELTASQESAAAFARRKGISKSRIQYWQERLKAAPAFVRVELPRVQPSAHIEIVCAAATIRVREDLDVERIAALAMAVARARC